MRLVGSVMGLGVRGQGPGFRVQGSGAGFRVEGLGFRGKPLPDTTHPSRAVHVSRRNRGGPPNSISAGDVEGTLAALFLYGVV